MLTLFYYYSSIEQLEGYTKIGEMFDDGFESAGSSYSSDSATFYLVGENVDESVIDVIDTFVGMEVKDVLELYPALLTNASCTAEALNCRIADVNVDITLEDLISVNADIEKMKEKQRFPRLYESEVLLSSKITSIVPKSIVYDVIITEESRQVMDDVEKSELGISKIIYRLPAYLTSSSKYYNIFVPDEETVEVEEQDNDNSSEEMTDEEVLMAMLGLLEGYQNELDSVNKLVLKDYCGKKLSDLVQCGMDVTSWTELNDNCYISLSLDDWSLIPEIENFVNELNGLSLAELYKRYSYFSPWFLSEGIRASWGDIPITFDIEGLDKEAYSIFATRGVSITDYREFDNCTITNVKLRDISNFFINATLEEEHEKIVAEVSDALDYIEDNLDSIVVDTVYISAP